MITIQCIDLNQCIQGTSETLLQIVSKLVSAGSVICQFLSLAKSIQYLSAKKSNQTTLGLSGKLHNRFGSKELTTILHDHGYILSYDEVLRFRKSAAKFTADFCYQVEDLGISNGLVDAWFDNFDLQVSTVNGCRETYATAVEFTSI